jgi:predicted PurR-regulated permease PerM
MTVTFYIIFNVLVVSRPFLVPLILACFLAIVLSPMVGWLVRKRVNRLISVLIVVLTSIAFLTGFFVVIFSQVSVLSESSGAILTTFQSLSDGLFASLSQLFNLSPEDLEYWKTRLSQELSSNGGVVLGITLTSLLDVFKIIFVVPVYVFMFLFYQPHLLAFIHKLFRMADDGEVEEALSATKKVIQSYIVGLFAEFAIIAVLNTAGLFILGIQYAILLGVASALLNIIPYLGGLVNMLIFMLIALLTKPPIYVLYVLILYLVIQFIDNNFIVPKIVGSKVQLNAFVSLLAVVLGAVLWGIPGMFLSIPLLAIVKVLTDRIDTFKSVGFVLGEMKKEEGIV